MKKMLKRFKNERGLTLVELLAVIVILGIVGAIAFVMIGNVIENSKQDAHIANAQQLIASAKLYDSQKGMDVGDSVNSGDLRKEGLIDELINPWDSDDEYTGTVKKVNKDDGVTYEVTIKGGEKTIKDATEKTLAGDRDDVWPEESGNL